MSRYAVLFLLITLGTPVWATEFDLQSSHHLSKPMVPKNERPKEKEDKRPKGDLTDMTPPDIDLPKSTQNPPPITTDEFCKKHPGKLGCPEKK